MSRSKILKYNNNAYSDTEKSQIKNISQDHFYYNISITNTTVDPIPATYKETRSSSILDIPSDYTASVIRFSIQDNNIPFFLFQPRFQYGTTPDIWNVTTGYVFAQAVQYLGIYYLSVVNNNLGHQPDISPLFWQSLVWSSLTNYPFGAIVTYNGVTYKSLINNNLNNIPTVNLLAWTPNVGNPFLINPCPNFSIYSVTLTYAGVDYREFLIYNPAQNLAGVPVPSSWAGLNSSNSNYYSVFSINEMVDMINQAFKSAYNRVPGGSPPKLAGASAPFVTYDSTTLKLALVAHQSYDSVFAGTNTVEVWCDGPLYRYLQDMPIQSINRFTNNPNGKFAQFHIYEKSNNFDSVVPPDILYSPWQTNLSYQPGQGVSFNNLNYVAINPNINEQPNLFPADWTTQAIFKPPATWSVTGVYAVGAVVIYQGYFYINRTGVNGASPPPSDTTNWNSYSGFDSYVMSVEFAQLFNWIDLETIVFTTSNIPIVSEYIPSSNDLANTSSVTANSTLSILADFIPAIQTGVDIRTNIVFFNQGEYKLMNLASNTPLQSVDIQLYWTDNKNTLYPVFIAPGGLVTVKILFRKKGFLIY
jgi:hypothetical protein